MGDSQKIGAWREQGGAVTGTPRAPGGAIAPHEVKEACEGFDSLPFVPPGDPRTELAARFTRSRPRLWLLREHPGSPEDAAAAAIEHAVRACLGSASSA